MVHPYAFNMFTNHFTLWVKLKLLILFKVIAHHQQRQAVVASASATENDIVNRIAIDKR